MLTKLIFLLHLTLSVRGVKIWKTKPIRKSRGIQRNKKLRRPKKSGQKLIFISRSLRVRLFRYLLSVINFYESATFDISVLLTTMLFILKKFLLLLILAICSVIDSLLKEDINGN